MFGHTRLFHARQKCSLRLHFIYCITIRRTKMPTPTYSALSFFISRVQRTYQGFITIIYLMNKRIENFVSKCLAMQKAQKCQKCRISHYWLESLKIMGILYNIRLFDYHTISAASHFDFQYHFYIILIFELRASIESIFVTHIFITLILSFS